MSKHAEIDSHLEYQYNNMARRSDAGEVLARLAERSAAYRKHADAELDCRYGDAERELVDLFRCGAQGAPLFVYLHGGYWQRGDKSMYSYLAEAFNAAGIDVAIVGYPLCPQVSMTRLVQSVRTALAWLWRRGEDMGLCVGRLNLCGHSAGGHLTAMALATRWPEFAEDLPPDLLKSAVPISGLYLLEPLRNTSIGEALRLDDAETLALSPALLSPAHPAPMLCIVGGAETSEFFRQRDSLADAWAQPQMVIEQHVEREADHFDVIARMQSADCEIFRRIVAWLR